jgi:hypothetical protein
MKKYVVMLICLSFFGCAGFQQTRHDVNEVFKAEKQIVQDIKKWALALEKERPTKLGVMNAVKDTFKTSSNYTQTLTMLTKDKDKTPEYFRAYDLVLYLKALGYAAKDILLALIGDTIDLADLISVAVGG